jgi:hypothetical protein
VDNKAGDIKLDFLKKRPEWKKQPKKHSLLLQDITNHLHIFATYFPSTEFQVVSGIREGRALSYLFVLK